MRILFVCTGNTCRSPLAEGALRQVLVAELGADAARVEVVSAGTAAFEGQPASAHSIEVAAPDGIDLKGHRSRRMTPELARSSDLVLVMEPSHLAAVRTIGARPETSHVLSAWPRPDEPGLEIVDPFGGSREAYEECWHRIRHHVKRVAPHIIEALRSQSM